MTPADLVLLVFYAVGMSCGQVLFKLAADHAKIASGGFWIGLLGSWHFYLSLVVYGVLTIAWVWLLTRIPLSRAYPFVVLAFVVTPLLAALLFGEKLDARYFTSLALIVAGLALLATAKAP